MTHRVSFDARVEPLTWGRSTYTIVRLLTEALTNLRKTRRVEG